MTVLLRNVFHSRSLPTQVLLCLVFAPLFVILLGGYEGYTTDHGQYLLGIMAKTQSDFAINDWFTYQTHAYHYTFEHFLSFFSSLGMLTEGLLVWKLVTDAFLGLAVLLWTRYLGGSFSQAALVLATYMLGVNYGWGEYRLTYSGSLASAAIYPAILLALLALFQRKLPFFFILTALAIWIHVAGGILFGFLSAFFLFGTFKKTDITWKNLVWGSLAIILIFPIMIKTINDFGGNALSADALKVFFFGRSPHHYLPQYAGLKVHVASIFGLALLMFGLVAFSDREMTRKFKEFSIIVLAGCLISVLLVSAEMGYFWVKLFPFRLLPVLIFFGYLLTIRVVSSGSESQRWIGLALLGFSAPIHFFPKYALVVGLGVGIFVFMIYYFRPGIAFRRPLPRWGIAAVGYIFAGFFLYKIQKGGLHWRMWANGSEVQRMETFASHIPSGSVTMVPPGLENFRIFAKRAVFVDFKSFPLIPEEINEWTRRMTALTGLHPLEVFRLWRASSARRILGIYETLYQDRSQSELKSVLKEHHIDFLLVYHNSKFATETRDEGLVYHDAQFRLYRVADLFRKDPESL